ncbi:MAG TPA: 16S rRNA (cytidine(1402)-2'-O)-methyltransferase [Pyrinomonadaceae bacterium]|nr:16S rRNA (cytidine(1402)-2'-O)-methyltransferase [Pyrinomonadaceae bacterium]
MSGRLYVVSTPIGNLEDITHRAVRVLGEVDVIACEDTRHTRKLLNHYGIKTPTISYHEHNEEERASELLKQLKAGAEIALVSDAGTPSVSDPGYRLVRLALDAEISVVPVPGPVALVAGLVASGLPPDEFFFGGFLPARSTARRTRLAEVAGMPSTLIFYEAPHRIAAALKDTLEILGERRAVVARELTKLHEEIVTGTLSELAQHFLTKEAARGEMVLLIDKGVIDKPTTEESVGSLVTKFEAEGVDFRQALKKAARELGISRAEAYRRLTVEKGKL